MRRALFLLLVLLIAGCNPQKLAMKRWQRDLQRWPEMGQADTIRDTIRVFVDREVYDTAIVVYVHDTIRLDSGRVHIKVVRMGTGGPCDTVRVPLYIQAACDSAVKLVPYEKVVQKLVPCPEGWRGVASWWRVVALVLAAVLLVMIVVQVRR